MLIDNVWGQIPQNKDDTKMAERMLNSLKMLREKKLTSCKPESDAEILVIDKMIHGFESDLKKKA